MSNYPGRRAHNLVNLNIIPSEHDQQQEANYNFAGDSDLSVFADTSEFLNLDWVEEMNGTGNGGNIVNTAAVGATTDGRANGTANGAVGQEGLDFSNGNYLFGPSHFDPTEQRRGMPPSSNPTAFPQALTSPTYSNSSPTFEGAAFTSPQSQSSPSFPPGQTPTSNPESAEESARIAAEEDKRRRNTAASARFRVKKKQREQALEKNTKELSDKVTALEGKIAQLQQENGWLKGLVVEKNGQQVLTEKYQKFTRESEEAEDGDRSSKAPKKGVGTKAAEA